MSPTTAAVSPSRKMPRKPPTVSAGPRSTGAAAMPGRVCKGRLGCFHQRRSTPCLSMIDIILLGVGSGA